jgi:hypothetical protein
MTTNNRIQNAGTTLDDILQPYVSGDILQTQTTNIQNGGQDIRLRYAGRDDNPSNGYTGTMNLTSRIGNLTNVFNKKNATYDITIGGTATYNGASQIPTVITRSPSNTPTQATLTSSTTINPGSYTMANYTVALPGNYLAGTYSGTFTIQKILLTSFTANSNWNTTLGRWTVTSITLGNGPNGVFFSNFILNVGVNTTVNNQRLPINDVSGNFTSNGTYTYEITAPNPQSQAGAVCNPSPSSTADGQLTLTIPESTYYTATTLIARLINPRKVVLTSLTANYGRGGASGFTFNVRSITFGIGNFNEPFSNFILSAGTNTTSQSLPISISGNFSSNGTFTYTNTFGCNASPNTTGNGQLILTIPNSTEYTATTLSFTLVQNN